MPIEIQPEWQRLAIYAVIAAVVLTLLFSIPKVGRVIRAVFSLAMFALALFLLFRQAPFDPGLSQFASRLGLDRQVVAGQEVRIRLSPDGHFWAEADIGGVRRRMLVDTGATVTVISEDTAKAAGIEPDKAVLPVILRTASGVVRAQTGTINRLSLGGIEARNLKAVISPSLGPISVLGMNFLSQLGAWRVEGRTLILTPKTEA